MTERGLPIVDGAPACPFVAFADERDERATSPDHRHRCYAEVEPAPRALAHQEAYCLSSAFPVCPTFQDWARREAARASTAAGSVAAPRPDPVRDQPAHRPPGQLDPSERPTTGTPILSSRPDVGEPRPDRATAAAGGLAGAAGAAGVAGAAAGAGHGAATGGGVPGQPAGPGRPGRPNVAGPASGGPGLQAGPGGPGGGRPGDPPRDSVDAPGFLVRRTEPGGGLAGSGADRLASAGERARGAEATGARPVEIPRAPQTRLAGGQVGATSGRRRDEFDDDFDEDLDSSESWRDPARNAQAPATTSDRIRSAFGVGSDRRPRVGDTRSRGAADVPPARPPTRRNDAHPTSRTRLGTPAVSRLAVIALALVIAAIALYFLPELLIGRDRDDTGAAGGVPSASASAAPSASVEPSVSAAPTPLVYVVQEGDTLENIREEFGLTLAELRAANPQITNPDRIRIGDEIIIPQGEPAASVGPSPDADASAGPSP